MRALWLCLALLCSASLSAQESSLSLTVSPPEASEDASPTPSSGQETPSEISGTLSGASSELAQIADELETLFAKLNESLKAAGIFQDGSEQSLLDSIRSATNGIASLRALRTDLVKAQKLNRRRETELWVWRAAAAVGALAALYFGTRK